MTAWLLAAGVFLIIASLLDIFLTTLYARSGASILSPFLSKGMWRLFRLISIPFGRHQGTVLSFAGPIILAMMAAVWVLLLVAGFALIYWPELGTGLKKSIGPTPTDFVTALYYSGFCLSTLGIGDIAPSSQAPQLLSVIQAALGFSFFTLTITYFLSVYSALQRRNTLASILHHMTAGEGTARRYIISVGAGGSFSATARDLSDLAARTADLIEAHTFYPVLHYFHFRQLRYALPRMALLLLDTATLVSTLPLPGGENLRTSASQLDTAVRDLLERLAATFHTGHAPEDYPSGREDEEAWKGHYEDIARALREAGVPSAAEEAREKYLTLRRQWHPFIAALSASLGYDLGKVAPSRKPDGLKRNSAAD